MSHPPVLFGTDGIRGPVAQGILVPHHLAQLGVAIGQTLGRGKTLVVGSDTRLSCAMIKHNLAGGLTFMGAHVIDAGVLSTPALAFTAKKMGADLGVMISASHNPACDNGIKLFGPDGRKIPDTTERQIEHFFASLPSLEKNEGPSAETFEHFGQFTQNHELVRLYIDHLYQHYRHLDFSSLTLVLDLANGALSAYAADVFTFFGAKVHCIGNIPNGLNINEKGGATHPDALSQAVVAQKADLGFTFDGDGDRVLMALPSGELLDGDQILALIAQSWQQHGHLKPAHVISTVMANRGLQTFLRDLNITCDKAAVGDRWVAQKMLETGAPLGGESSGHIILGPLTTTGDGLMVALEVLNAIIMSPDALSRPFEESPQVLRSVRVDKSVLTHPAWVAYLDQFDKRWGDQVTTLIRPSGTEPLVRVMLQGENHDLIHQLCEGLCQTLTAIHHGAHHHLTP